MSLSSTITLYGAAAGDSPFATYSIAGQETLRVCTADTYPTKRSMRIAHRASKKAGVDIDSHLIQFTYHKESGALAGDMVLNLTLSIPRNALFGPSDPTLMLNHLVDLLSTNSAPLSDVAVVTPWLRGES